MNISRNQQDMLYGNAGGGNPKNAGRKDNRIFAECGCEVSC